MSDSGPLSIGEAMVMAAMITGTDPEAIDGFLVITTNKDGSGKLVHNCTSYLTLIATLLERTQDLVAEMRVDQAIEFQAVPGSHDQGPDKTLPVLALAAPVRPGQGPAHRTMPAVRHTAQLVPGSSRADSRLVT